MELFTQQSATIAIRKTFFIGQHYQIRILLLIECDGGMFGHNCSQSCGKCFNNEQCHHINGTCLNGCDSGYSGTNCTEGTDKTMKV